MLISLVAVRDTEISCHIKIQVNEITKHIQYRKIRITYSVRIIGIFIYSHIIILMLCLISDLLGALGTSLSHLSVL